MDNLKLLEYCRQNPEAFLDENYMFIDKDPNLNSYVAKTKKIKNKLIAIKELVNKKGAKEILGTLFEELRTELDKFANNSELGSFINACDSKLEEAASNLSLLKNITGIYLEKRDLNEVVPSEWIQALIDKTTSRKKGHSGENKLIKILGNFGFGVVKNINDFNNEKRCVAKCSSRGDFSNKGIKQHFKIKIGKNTQNKKLDLVVKLKYHVYFLEAKHLNAGGGEQDKQIKELIDVIKNKPHDNYHFVAFLDGIRSNALLDAGDKATGLNKKIKAQHKDIIKYLRSNRNNYWINTAGFIKLFS